MTEVPTAPSAVIEERLQTAMSDALALYEAGVGAAFPVPVRCELINNPAFYAEAALEDDGYVIRIHSGCIAKISELWRNSWQSPVLTDSDGERLISVEGDTDAPTILADMSLIWLVLHELMHIRLGHLDVLGTSSLIETEIEAKPLSDGHADNIPQILPPETKALIDAVVPQNKRPELRRCLEMQADNEATEIMIGAFSEDRWVQMRADAACIFVVMALIETNNTKSHSDDRTHPRASTRFFTLMAQLFQYWLYHPGTELESAGEESKIKTKKLPQSDDFERYSKEVLMPIINDAVVIATWAEAKTFLSDLGDKGALFTDIFEAQYAENLATAKLKTVAAKEWRDLLPVNEKIMVVTGLRS